jgi:hypothetical protein
MAIIAIVAVLPTSFVYAQTTTANNTTVNATTTTTSAPIELVTPSAAAQQIINNTQTECKQAQFSPRKCVMLVYESPTTIVLNGDILIFGGSAGSIGYHQNPFLWRAVDGFKTQGYTITAIEMTIGGNKTIDDKFNVIMSK